jgi:hypothetical protein
MYFHRHIFASQPILPIIIHGRITWILILGSFIIVRLHHVIPETRDRAHYTERFADRDDLKTFFCQLPLKCRW